MTSTSVKKVSLIALGISLFSALSFAGDRILQHETTSIKVQALDSVTEPMAIDPEASLPSEFSPVLADFSEIVLSPVQFRTNSSAIEAEYLAQLQQWVQLMHVQPELNIELNGFTDPRGNADYNQRLSERRANAVKQVFVDGGIAAKRLIANAQGESDAESGEFDLDGYFFERKVTLKIYAAPSPIAAQQTAAM